MAFEFQFSGGVRNPTKHTNEKFLLFFVIGGKEVPLYSLLRDSLVLRVDEVVQTYTSGNNIAKLFIGESGFGLARRFHSFYMRLLDDTAPAITIVPFSGADGGWHFKAKVSFLKKREVLSILDASSDSLRFIERQITLPVNTLNSIITVDRSDLRRGVRHVRIGKQQPGEASIADRFLEKE